MKRVPVLALFNYKSPIFGWFVSWIRNTLKLGMVASGSRQSRKFLTFLTILTRKTEDFLTKATNLRQLRQDGYVVGGCRCRRADLGHHRGLLWNQQSEEFRPWWQGESKVLLSLFLDTYVVNRQWKKVIFFIFLRAPKWRSRALSTCPITKSLCCGLFRIISFYTYMLKVTSVNTFWEGM